MQILDVHTGEVRDLASVAVDGPPIDSLLAWSPDGEWIYYLHNHQTWDSETSKYQRSIDRIRVTTGETEELVPWAELDGGYNSALQRPVFAADGSLRYVEGSVLWAMNPDGSNRRVLDPDFAGWSLSAPTL